MSVPGSVAMQRPTGEVPQMGPAASRGPLVKWPPNLKSPSIIRISMMVLPRISLPKMRRLSKIGVLATILGAFLFLPGGSAHLGTIDTLSMSFTGPCIYDGSYGKANLILSTKSHWSLLSEISLIFQITDDPVFTYSGGSSSTMTPASCLEGEEGVPRKRGFLKTVNILTIKKGGKSQTKNSNILQKKTESVNVQN